jgi:hypothetical protein
MIITLEVCDVKMTLESIHLNFESNSFLFLYKILNGAIVLEVVKALKKDSGIKLST